MKRFFAFLAIIVISLALFSGCRQNDDDAVVERLSTTAVSNMRATAYQPNSVSSLVASIAYLKS